MKLIFSFIYDTVDGYHSVICDYFDATFVTFLMTINCDLVGSSFLCVTTGDITHFKFFLKCLNSRHHACILSLVYILAK